MLFEELNTPLSEEQFFDENKDKKIFIKKSYESSNTNETQKRNKRYRGRNNTELCRKRFKNHSHFRRADLLSRS